MGNQGAHPHGHTILSLPFYNFGIILEDPSSIMRNPMHGRFHSTFISSICSVNMLLMNTFVPNHSQLVNVFVPFCSWFFLQGFQSSLVARGPSHCRSYYFPESYPSWGPLTYINQLISRARHQDIKYFRRDSYPIPSNFHVTWAWNLYTYYGFHHALRYYLIIGASRGLPKYLHQSFLSIAFLYLSSTWGCPPLAVVLPQQIQSFPTHNTHHQIHNYINDHIK